jgi:hypothetical protein
LGNVFHGILSVFFGQHDRDHALGNGGVCRVGRVLAEVAVVVINLEEESVPVDFERTKVVFFVGVVGVAKVVAPAACRWAFLKTRDE